MAHTQAHPDPLPETVAKGYEVHDLKTSWIVWCAVIFILAAIVIQLGLWYMLKAVAAHKRAVDEPQSVLIDEPPVPTAPLQPTQQHDRTPPEDLEAMRQREDAVFEQLGWQVNPKTHDVTIPGDIVQRIAKNRAAQPGGAR
jgi:hypothetical protein